MGLTSSQIQEPPLDEAAIGSQVGKRDKKSDDMKGAIDDAYESAQALVQLSAAPEANGALDDNFAASQQLRAESSPVHSSKVSNGRASVARSSQRASNRRKHDKNHKKQRKGYSTWWEGGENGDHNERAADIPSTPRGQILRSSPPLYRPPVSQPSHALDDIPTDDEDVTIYMQEYEQESQRSQRPEASDYDIYSHSQQPTDFADEQGYGSATYPAYHPPKEVYTSSKPLVKTKKRKRDSARTQDMTRDVQLPLESGKGQHAPVLEFTDVYASP